MAPPMYSITPEQLDTLLNFLDEHRDLARGRLRSLEGKLQAKRLWGELCNLLNSMGGCTKTVAQWQKVWSDRKHLAKRAAAESRRSASMTGGGPSTTSPLSQWELKVLSIMGEGFGQRQTEARVPLFPEMSEPAPSAPSTSSHPPNELPLPELTVNEEDSRETTDVERQPSVRFSQSSRRRRSRRTQSAARSGDVTGRLFEYEDRREEIGRATNTELAGIRVALEELCGIQRQILNRLAHISERM